LIQKHNMKEEDSSISEEIKSMVWKNFLIKYFWYISKKLRKQKFFDKEWLLKEVKNLLERTLNWKKIRNWVNKVNVNVFRSLESWKWFVDYVNIDEDWRKKHYKEENFFKKIWLTTAPIEDNLNLNNFKTFQPITDKSWFISIDSVFWWNFIIHFDWYNHFQEKIIENLINNLLDVIKWKLHEIEYKYTNQVTWCKNWNYFQEHKNEKNYSVIAIDLNSFKVINDVYWHAQWDIVLRKFWKLLNSCIRENEWEIIHLYGDEFCIIIKTDDEWNYFETINDINKRINQLEKEWDFLIKLKNEKSWLEEEVEIKYSMWLCENKIEGWTLTMEECYKNADKKMLESKSKEWIVYRMSTNLDKFKWEEQEIILKMIIEKLGLQISDVLKTKTEKKKL
jgi:diguanylate cyclase (GGDEF)-like protein